VWGKRVAAYLGFASVFAACAGAGYRALHPSIAATSEGVLIWASPQPGSKPLLLQTSPAEKQTTPAHWSASWPADPSSAAVPFFSDMIQMGISLNEDDEDSGDPVTDVPPRPGSDRAATAQAEKLSEKSPVVSPGTTGQGGSPPAEAAGKGSDRDEHSRGWTERRHWQYSHYSRHSHRRHRY
jgi:hypothetical protein